MPQVLGSRPDDPGELADRMISVVRRIGAASSRNEIAGLSNARYQVLHTIVHEGPLRMGLIAKRLGCSPRTLTPMVDALEAEGLLRRERDLADRRALRLALTPDGLVLMRRAHSERTAMAGVVFAPLGPEEREALPRLLDKVLVPEDEPAPPPG